MNFNIHIINRENEKHLKQWEHVTENSDGATIFHEHKFLSYHGKRFPEKHLGIYKGSTIHGLIPLCIDSELTAKSPYGASYGGFLFSNKLNYKEAKNICSLFIDFLSSEQVKKIVITPPISTYYKDPDETFIFSMLERGFEFFNSDITHILQIESDFKKKYSSRVVRSIKKATSNNVKVILNGDINDFWSVLEKNFKKHSVNPTHSFNEWKLLCSIYPEKIFMPIAYFENTPVAALGCLQINAQCTMFFYILQDPEYQDKQSLSFLIHSTIEHIAKNNISEYIDFGTSSVNMIGRENIFEFKESYGAVGVFRHSLVKYIK